MTMKRPRTPHRLAPFLDYTVHFSARSSRLRTRPEVSHFSNPGLTVALQLTVNPSGRARNGASICRQAMAGIALEQGEGTE